jgi:hypothetical protein
VSKLELTESAVTPQMSGYTTYDKLLGCKQIAKGYILPYVALLYLLAVLVLFNCNLALLLEENKIYQICSRYGRRI